MSRKLRQNNIKTFLREQDIVNLDEQYIKYFGIEYPDGRTDTLTPGTLEKLVSSYYNVDDIEFDVVCWFIDEEKLVKDIIKESDKLYKKYFKVPVKRKPRNKKVDE